MRRAAGGWPRAAAGASAAALVLGGHAAWPWLAKGLWRTAAEGAADAALGFGLAAMLVLWPLAALAEHTRRRPSPRLAVRALALSGCALASFVALRWALPWALPGDVSGPDGGRALAAAAAVAAGIVVLGWRPSGDGVPSRARPLGLAAAALLVAGFAALAIAPRVWPKATRDGAPDIVFVVIDCLRRDHVSAYGYERDTTPFLDRLAEGGMLFTRAYSTAGWTKPAIASVLTGRYPHRHRVVDAADRFTMPYAVLGERLRDRGYATIFLNGGNTFISDIFGFERGFDVYELVRPAQAERLNEHVAEALARADPDRPLFAYVHYMDVHLPYNENVHNRRYTRDLEGIREELTPNNIKVGPVREMTEAGELTADDRRDIVDLYDGQVRFVDDQLARLAELLEQAGRGQRTVWIVTSDHGEEFWEHGNYEHGHSLYEEVVCVPLVVHGAGVPAARVDAPVSLVDVYTTILDLAGVRADATADGEHLLHHADPAHSEARRDRTLLLMGTLYGGEKLGVIEDGIKAIRNTDRTRSEWWKLVGATATEPIEIYDLGRDPGEHACLVEGSPRKAAHWRGFLDEILQRSEQGGYAPEQQVLDDDVRQRLRDTGYVQ